MIGTMGDGTFRKIITELCQDIQDKLPHEEDVDSVPPAVMYDMFPMIRVLAMAVELLMVPGLNLDDPASSWLLAKVDAESRRREYTVVQIDEALALESGIHDSSVSAAPR